MPGLEPEDFGMREERGLFERLCSPTIATSPLEAMFWLALAAASAGAFGFALGHFSGAVGP